MTTDIILLTAHNYWQQEKNTQVERSNALFCCYSPSDNINYHGIPGHKKKNT